MVAGQGGGDAADLLVPGHRQERRGAAVALHPDQEHIRLRMGQFGDPVRVDGAAGVHVRVDQRRQLDRGLQHRIQAEADFREPGQVGPESGEHHHPIDVVDAGAGVGDQRHPAAVAVGFDGGGAESGNHRQQSVVDRPLGA